jgi:hypothetical protein
MPSRYEPCGLNQMYSLRYGTVPVVRATGGLADTVVDAGDSERGTGFVFRDYTADSFAGAVSRAVQAFGTPAWRAIQLRGMAQDFSWTHPAAEYLKLYDRLLQADGGAPAAPRADAEKESPATEVEAQDHAAGVAAAPAGDAALGMVDSLAAPKVSS